MNDEQEQIFDRYTQHVAAYCLDVKINGVDPCEKFMRTIEEGAAVPESGAHDYRHKMMSELGSMMIFERAGFGDDFVPRELWDVAPNLKAGIEAAQNKGY